MFELEVQCPRCKKIRKMRTGVMRREDFIWLRTSCSYCGKGFKLISNENRFNRILSAKKLR